MKLLFLLILAASLFSSCAKKNAEEQAIEDETIITQYIIDQSLTATPTGSGLYYVIDTEGTGISPTSSSTVRVAYSGYLTDGTAFDESDVTGIEFGLQQVIQGWTEGIPYFKEGGTGKLLIPSALGYGKSGSGSIPGNTVLIFDINLIEVL